MSASRSALFRQLTVCRSVCVALCIAVHKLFDAYCGSTYAQSGEDLLILSNMHGCSSNYYVDVGCNHPIKYSNTYLLYQMGWRGLCLDANEYLVRQFRRVRPKDRVDWVCVGGKAGEITFSISRDPALSHVVGNTLVNSRASDEDRRIVIAVKTLQQLFEENNVPAQFGLLSIDLEGHDFIALKSFDIRRWRPYLIVIEIHGLDLEICAENEIVAYLRNAGYKIVCFDANNAIFQNMDAANNC